MCFLGHVPHHWLLIVFSLALFSFAFICVCKAETFYSWDIYEDLDLNVSYHITSNSNNEVADTALYSSMISDLQNNLSEYGIEKYEFVYYFRLDSGGGLIQSPVLRFGSLSPITADSGTGSVRLDSTNENAVYPFAFSIPANKIGLYTPRMQFYITLLSGVSEFDFTLTGISCKAVRTAPPSDIRLLQSIQDNTYTLNYVLALIVALLVCMIAIRAFKRLFYAFS